MLEKAKTNSPLNTAVVVGEIAVAGITLALKVAGLFRARVKA